MSDDHVISPRLQSTFIPCEPHHQLEVPGGNASLTIHGLCDRNATVTSMPGSGHEGSSDKLAGVTGFGASSPADSSSVCAIEPVAHAPLPADGSGSAAGASHTLSDALPLVMMHLNMLHDLITKSSIGSNAGLGGDSGRASSARAPMDALPSSSNMGTHSRPTGAANNAQQAWSPKVLPTGPIDLTTEKSELPPTHTLVAAADSENTGHAVYSSLPSEEFCLATAPGSSNYPIFQGPTTLSTGCRGCSPRGSSIPVAAPQSPTGCGGFLSQMSPVAQRQMLDWLQHAGNCISERANSAGENTEESPSNAGEPHPCPDVLYHSEAQWKAKRLFDSNLSQQGGKQTYAGADAYAMLSPSALSSVTGGSVFPYSGAANSSLLPSVTASTLPRLSNDGSDYTPAAAVWVCEHCKSCLPMNASTMSSAVHTLPRVDRGIQTEPARCGARCLAAGDVNDKMDPESFDSMTVSGSPGRDDKFSHLTHSTGTESCSKPFTEYPWSEVPPNAVHMVSTAERRFTHNMPYGCRGRRLTGGRRPRLRPWVAHAAASADPPISSSASRARGAGVPSYDYRQEVKLACLPADFLGHSRTAFKHHPSDLPKNLPANTFRRTTPPAASSTAQSRSESPFEWARHLNFDASIDGSQVHDDTSSHSQAAEDCDMFTNSKSSNVSHATPASPKCAAWPRNATGAPVRMQSESVPQKISNRRNNVSRYAISKHSIPKLSQDTSFEAAVPRLNMKEPQNERRGRTECRRGSGNPETWDGSDLSSQQTGHDLETGDNRNLIVGRPRIDRRESSCTMCKVSLHIYSPMYSPGLKVPLIICFFSRGAG
eukprot:GHVT01015249.1.p1 GENE.GHVT01015249.1~~GHVT01015249.1.p1  ORF type:complete len:825 (-),score=86.19 GHVT01015249.1:1683-4157(-)